MSTGIASDLRRKLAAAMPPDEPVAGSHERLHLLVGLVSLGLVSVGALTPEIQRLIPARRKVREHPLFFLEKLSAY
ncbi:hypothetical protein ANFP_07380 [Acidithiobacillus ferrooxidans]|nr:hypothetical protein ANFP_07380 [Acidithiobacillus ferrooxidans]